MKKEFLQLMEKDFDDVYISKFNEPYQHLIIEAFEKLLA